MKKDCEMLQNESKDKRKLDLITLEVYSKVIAEWGECGKSNYLNNSGCGTSYGSNSCFPSGVCTVY